MSGRVSRLVSVSAALINERTSWTGSTSITNRPVATFEVAPTADLICSNCAVPRWASAQQQSDINPEALQRGFVQGHTEARTIGNDNFAVNRDNRVQDNVLGQSTAYADGKHASHQRPWP